MHDGYCAIELQLATAPEALQVAFALSGRALAADSLHAICAAEGQSYWHLCDVTAGRSLCVRVHAVVWQQ